MKITIKRQIVMRIVAILVLIFVTRLFINQLYISRYINTISSLKQVVFVSPFIDEVSFRVCENKGLDGYNIKFHGINGAFILSIDTTLTKFSGYEWRSYDRFAEFIPFKIGQTDLYYCNKDE